MGDSVFPKTAQNAVRRHAERGHYDEKTVADIINGTPVAHVSFVPDPSDPRPVILPMIARMGRFDEDGPACCYVHGYVSARLFRLPSQSSSSSPPLEEAAGVPVCVAATQVVNLVLALTPFNHSYDYRSAVLHGRATLLDPAADRDEVLWALRLITDGVVPGRWDRSRVPPDEAEIAATRVLRVRIDSASAKIRDAGVKDDRKDLERRDGVRERVWTGVVPYRETLGTPVPAETNLVGEVPDYISDYIREHNRRAGAGQESGAEGGLVSRVMGSLFGS